MKVIKYRAWNKTTKSMLCDYATQSSTYGELSITQFHPKAYSDKSCPSLDLMQFTELKDRSGNDIYEGDIIEFHPAPGSSIVRCNDDENPLIRYIKWDNKYACWTLYQTNGDKQSAGFTFCKRNCESIVDIIGNIYENSDLLD